MALSAAGAAASAIGSKKANDKQQAALNNARAASNAFYDSEIYQDPTKRSDNQAYLKLLDKKLKRTNEIAEAKNKIMGGTHEQTLATHQKTADAYSDAITNMVSNTSQRRDNLLKEKRAAITNYDQQQAGIDAAQMQNWANLANNAAQLGASAISGFSGGGEGKAGSSDKMENLDVRKTTADGVSVPESGYSAPDHIDLMKPIGG